MTNTTADENIDMSISDVDYRLIGLSPQYWSYTPMLIGDLIGLPLINGVDCLLTTSQHHTQRNVVDDASENDMQQKDENENEKSWNILPLSRVLLRGIATAIDQRPNGCILIVLDDGTGAIDCRYWDDSQSHNAFSLPPLLAEHETIKKGRRCRFVVGDSLEVMGKIKTLTAGTSTSTLSTSSTTRLEARHGCVREVHASSVCLIEKGQTRMANQWNGETVHWLKSLNFFSKQCNTTNSTSKIRLRNGKDVLPLLGAAISNSILGDGSSDYTHLDRANDGNTVLHRKCCQTVASFRYAFFYCHCEATLEVLDPNLQFRDALLNRLLDMESQLQHTSDTAFSSATEDCMDLYGVVQSDALPPPLLFTFESIYKNEEITSIANEISVSSSSSSSSTTTANAQRLIRKTFAALTNDGILSLYDLEQDLYLLVSRARVIEPFLRRSGMGNGPFFIQCIPKKRIVQIMNWIKSSDAKQSI